MIRILSPFPGGRAAALPIHKSGGAPPLKLRATIENEIQHEKDFSFMLFDKDVESRMKEQNELLK